MSTVTRVTGAFMCPSSDLRCPAVNCSMVFVKITLDGAIKTKLRTPRACARYSTAPAKTYVLPTPVALSTTPSKGRGLLSTS